MADESGYQEEVNELHRIIRKGIEELCKHARENNFLDFPYGRKADPTPLITEEDFLKVYGGPDCDDQEPPFIFDYGFDPFKFLSDYISWAHPRSVESRRQGKVNAQARLSFRAKHAMKQLLTQKLLVERIGQLSAGIQWGPLTHAVTGTKLIITAQPLKPATVYVQLATDREFRHVIRTIRSNVVGDLNDGERGKNLLLHTEVGRLSPNTLYFVRCFAISFEEQGLQASIATVKVPNIVTLSDFDEESQQIADRWKNAFMCETWTLPTDSFLDLQNAYALSMESMRSLDVQFMLSFFGQFPSGFALSDHSLGNPDQDGKRDPRRLVAGTIRAPGYACILGDVLFHVEYHEDLNRYISQLINFFSRLANSFEGLRYNSLMLAWRDSHAHSGNALRLEEVAQKQYRHELKRYNKKYGIEEPGKGKAKGSTAAAAKANVHIPPPPELKRPPISLQQTAIMKAFPALSFLAQEAAAPPNKAKSDAAQAETDVLTPTSCRMLYRTRYLNPDVQLIFLDIRRTIGKQSSLGSDYLGKEQADWLHHILKHSVATWKIIACGKCFGISAFDDAIIPLDSVADYESSKEGKSVAEEAKASSIPVSNAEESAEQGTTDTSGGQANEEEATSRAAAASASNLYDDVDEVYGRSKYSLQHVLAEYEKWLITESNLLMPTPIELAPVELLVAPEGCEQKSVYVSSGVILITSGVTSFISRTFKPVKSADPTVSDPAAAVPRVESNGAKATTNGSTTGSTASSKNSGSNSRPNSGSKPSSNANIQSAPLQYEVLYSKVDEISAPCFVTTFDSLNAGSIAPTLVSSSLSNSSTMMGFCTELSLGTNTELSDGGSHGWWKYSPGLVGTTSYLSQDDNKGDCLTTCEMQILANNTLYVEIFSVDINAAVEEKKRIAVINFAIASFATNGDDESLGSSIHMV
eukprot:gene2975-3243_t